MKVEDLPMTLEMIQAMRALVESVGADADQVTSVSIHPLEGIEEGCVEVRWQAKATITYEEFAERMFGEK